MIEQTNRGLRDIISDLSGGVNNFYDPSKIGENEFALYDNLISFKKGRFLNATRRKGFERYNTAKLNNSTEIENTYQFLNPDINMVLVKTAESIERLKETAFLNVATGLDSGRADFETASNNLYAGGLKISGELITNRFYDGTNWLEMGCIPLLLDKTLYTEITGGEVNFSAGDYYYIITFLYEGRQESGIVGTIGKRVTVTANRQFINIYDIPTGNERVTSRKVYRGKKDDPSNVYFIGSINDNTEDEYVDSKPDAELGTPIPIESFHELKRPYKSVYQEVHKERLVQANLEDEQFAPIPDGDISFENLDTGLVTPGVYRYRFYKVWLSQITYDINHMTLPVSIHLEKEHTLPALKSGIKINYLGQDDWFNHMVVQRTSVNMTDDFKSLPLILYRTTTPGTHFPLEDTYSDINRKAIGINSNLSEIKFPNWISWSEAGKPDLFPSTNVLEIGKTDQEITGVFSEDSRIIVFKERSIYQVSTEVDNSAYWKVQKIVEHIGSPGRDYIEKLPSGGYFFIGEENVVYLWDGYGQPVRISDPVHEEVSGITKASVRYDRVSHWIRVVYDTASATGREINYDLNNGKWYPFKENELRVGGIVQLKLGAPYQLADGTMIYGGTNAGRLMKYGENAQDELNTTGNTFENVGILAKLQTRTYDTWRTVKEILSKLWASGNGTMQVKIGIGMSESPTTASITGDVTHIQTPVNKDAKEFYVRFENDENIDLSIKQIGHTYEPRHRESGGY